MEMVQLSGSYHLRRQFIRQFDGIFSVNGMATSSRAQLMTYGRKVVLHCPSGYELGLDKMIENFMNDGVVFVGVVGKDCAKVEDIIDELVVGDGSRAYELLTSSHPGKSVEEAVAFAASLTGNFAGEVQVVEL